MVLLAFRLHMSVDILVAEAMTLGVKAGVQVSSFF
jgi:hypothetical protein